MSTVDLILTKEERDILLLVAVHPGSKHLSNIEISQRLGIPVTRVKTLMHQACVKLGADNRNEAVLLAMRRREIMLSELLSLDELAEILISLDPFVLRGIADSVRQKHIPQTFPEKSNPIIGIDRKQPGDLTNGERDVLILVSYGLTNNKIAEKLFMSTDAVRTFLNRAFKKLGARKKADALQAALKRKEILLNEISSQDELAYYLAPMGVEAIEKLAQLLEDKQRKRPVPVAN